MTGTYPGLLPGGLSSDGYLDRRLRPLDAEHYSAAGLLPYRRRDSVVELLLPKEKPWNSFTQAYDPLSWNVFGGKRVPRQERSVETTAVRCFLETVGQASGAPDQDMLYGWMQKSFMIWYPMGKFALVMVEVPDDSLDDFPERYTAMKQQAGPEQEFRILPMGIKKWSKQIDELGWLPASSLLAETDTKEVSDLLGSMLNITSFREFLEGSVDPDKTLPERSAVQPRPEGDGNGKGKGKAKGQSRGWKGYGGGKSAGKGGGKGGMPVAKGMGPGIMYAGAKGMPVMSPMIYPQYEQNSAEMQRQMHGEQLYVLVQPMSPSPYLAQKITGMLLELPYEELCLNLTNREELQRRVSEALEVLREDGVA